MEEPDVTLDDFLQELIEYNSDYVLQPGEFTINAIMEEAEKAGRQIDRGRVTNDLHRRAKAGELGEKMERVNGSNQWVFWRIKNPAG